MPSIAICYDTTEGQTAKIARGMAEHAAERGHATECFDVRTLPDGFRPGTFDAVVVGGSVHYGRHARRLRRFVTERRRALSDMPTAFFSVSLSATGRRPQDRIEAQRLLDAFLRTTAWTPSVSGTIAGALLYRRYGWFKRLMMKQIVARNGGDTDTSRDYEYTDWTQVRSLIDEVLAVIDDEA